jgi:putative SOS response-associated peptidase YedK
VCGRYTLAGPDPAGVRARFGLDEALEIRPRYNVAPGDDVLAVTGDGGALLRWGLVPGWAKDPQALGLKLINARAESVTERPAFRESFARRRCLVVADGFYEWERRPDGTRRPWWITRPGGEPFAFAGVWASWRPRRDVEPLRTCAIVTTRASDAIAPLHDRMPVMLEPAAEAAWLDPATAPDDLLALCVPAEATAQRAVGPAVNDARHDAPDCLEPAQQPLTLF